MNRTLALVALPLVLLLLSACSSSPGASAAASGAPDVPTSPAGTVWMVTRVGGTFVDAANPPTIDFAADGKVSGTTGCNQYSGAYTLNGSEIAVEPLAMTMKLCEGSAGQAETLFAPAMQGATSWAIDESGNLLLSGAGDILARPAG